METNNNQTTSYPTNYTMTSKGIMLPTTTNVPISDLKTSSILLMVCVPLAVIILIIIVLCICLRKGERTLPTETYEDFSKVDQSVMMRMSVYDGIDNGNTAKNIKNGFSNVPNDSNVIEVTKSTPENMDDLHNIQVHNVQEDSCRDHKTTGDRPSVNGLKSQENDDTLTAGVYDGLPTSATSDGKSLLNTSKSCQLTEGDPKSLQLTETESKTLRNAGDGDDKETDVKLFQLTEDSKNSSSDYYTLKANFIPMPK